MHVRARVGRAVALVIGALALVATGWWAGRATLVSTVDEERDADGSVIVTVTEQTVGRSLSLTVTVRQPFVAVAVNGLAGTITSVEVADRADVGDVLYTVDTQPVRAVEGALPFYRDLRPGARGADVAQLQRALRSLGYYQGGDDGRYESGTAAAVRAWQRELGLPATGVVTLGEVVAVPVLPAPVRLDEAITTGSRVAGGEPAVLAPTGELEFALVLSQAQAAGIPPEASVVVSHEDNSWPAVITDTTTGTDGTVHFALAAPDGGPVCGPSCDTLPAREQASLRGAVTITPEVTGPTVPIAAVVSDPGGETHVLLADGTRREVSVRAASGGLAVVDGLSVGERVLVTGDAAQSVDQ